MIRTPERATQPEELTGITEQLKLLTAAVQEQNELLKACILQPEEQPARFMVGMYGALEVIDL